MFSAGGMVVGVVVVVKGREVGLLLSLLTMAVLSGGGGGGEEEGGEEEGGEEEGGEEEGGEEEGGSVRAPCWLSIPFHPRRNGRFGMSTRKCKMGSLFRTDVREALSGSIVFTLVRRI